MPLDFPFLIRGRYEDVTLHYCIMVGTDEHAVSATSTTTSLPFHHPCCHRRGTKRGIEEEKSKAHSNSSIESTQLIFHLRAEGGLGIIFNVK